MSVPVPPEISAFVEIWKGAFSRLLEQSGAANVTAPDADPEAIKLAALDDADTLAVRFSGGGCLKGVLQWSAPKTVALQCAQLLMAEPLDAAVEFTPTHLDGYEEFLRQVAGEASVAWSEARGAPAELTHESKATGTLAPRATASFSLESDKTHGLALRIDLDAEMVASLSPENVEPPEAEPEVPRAEPSGVQPSLANLNLILDVQLDATIRFGAREMLLQDVFGLMPGAVVELDQLVNEPAELLVAGRLVAKGDVVVVDGNFGLRVTEVLDRAQRAIAMSLG
jgi:flagellar motor switch protein FliN